MSYSSDLRDCDWEIIEKFLTPLLSFEGRGRRSRWSNRELLNGMLYQMKNGCNWSDLPKDYPPYSTVYWHYKKWRDKGIFAQILEKLHEEKRSSLKKTPNIPV